MNPNIGKLSTLHHELAIGYHSIHVAGDNYRAQLIGVRLGQSADSELSEPPSLTWVVRITVIEAPTFPLRSGQSPCWY